MSAPQSYANHTKFDPPFHFVALPLLLICFIASIVHVVHQPTPPNVLLAPLSFGALVAVVMTRRNPLKVQDRLIRLEETLRMERLGISHAGITTDQFVALRFAPDEELAALTARAKAEGLTRKQIKETIVNWRPDENRL